MGELRTLTSKNGWGEGGPGGHAGARTSETGGAPGQWSSLAPRWPLGRSARRHGGRNQAKGRGLAERPEGSLGHPHPQLCRAACIREASHGKNLEFRLVLRSGATSLSQNGVFCVASQQETGLCQCATTGLGTEVREPPPANPHRPRHAQQTTLPSRGQRTRWTVYIKATVYSLGVPVSPTNTPGWMSTNLQPARLPGGVARGGPEPQVWERLGGSGGEVTDLRGLPAGPSAHATGAG